MKTTQERLDNLLSAIFNGDGDDDLDSVYDAVKARHRVLEAEHGATIKCNLKVGDTVMIQDCSPKYLKGLQAKVISLEKSSAKVQIVKTDLPYAKRFQHNFLAPYCSLEKVS